MKEFKSDFILNADRKRFMTFLEELEVGEPVVVSTPEGDIFLKKKYKEESFSGCFTFNSAQDMRIFIDILKF